jgi:hypothetical protein
MAETFVQIPPNSTGAKVRTRDRVVGGNTVMEQAVYQTALQTYTVVADAATFTLNKHHITIVNAAGSGKIVSVKKMFLINNQLAVVTGVACRFDLKRVSAASGGTVISPVPCDSLNDAIPAAITVRTGATSVTEGALLFPLIIANDEAGATQAFPSSVLLAMFNIMPEGVEMQETRLRPGEGLTAKQITSTTVGSASWLIVFTIDDEV